MSFEEPSFEYDLYVQKLHEQETLEKFREIIGPIDRLIPSRHRRDCKRLNSTSFDDEIEYYIPADAQKYICDIHDLNAAVIKNFAQIHKAKKVVEVENIMCHLYRLNLKYERLSSQKFDAALEKQLAKLERVEKMIYKEEDARRSIEEIAQKKKLLSVCINDLYRNKQAEENFKMSNLQIYNELYKHLVSI